MRLRSPQTKRSAARGIHPAFNFGLVSASARNEHLLTAEASYGEKGPYGSSALLHKCGFDPGNSEMLTQL